MIPCMLNMCFMGVFISGVAFVCGVIFLNKRERETDRYIARLEAENRRLKEAVTNIERKAKGDRLIFTVSLDE